MSHIINDCSYSIGDEIDYAGSKWYVVDESDCDQDYVTLLKASLLTAEQIGDENNFGEKIGSQITHSNLTPYYWSDACHDKNSEYGSTLYGTEVLTDCEGHSDYSTSKVRNILEQRYLPTIQPNNLKEVNGYKIRLMTINDLVEKFGYHWSMSTNGSSSALNSLPLWLRVPDDKSYEWGCYWTMSPFTERDAADEVWCVGYRYSFGGIKVYNGAGVRPVINLLKSEIE